MDFHTFLGYLPNLLDGARETAILTSFTLVCGLAIAVPVATCRLSRLWPLRTFALTFVLFFRGAPLLVLLFLVYFGLADIPLVRETWLWTFFRDAYFCAIFALSLNSAGYLSEVIAGAVRAVPRGEVEAATVAGLSRFDIARLVIVPNAVRLGLRNYGNEIIFVIKGTSIASLVTIVELTRAANNIYFRTFDPFTPLIAAGVIYFVAIWLLSRGIRSLERRLTPQLRMKANASQL
ncbi:ABC transporter permease subunit [Ahrensia marina]|uniref:ABC transporter permease n=1 Tax=Ahrensia marina TaxID=1514904 RepID=UPI0035CEFD28